MSHPLGSKNNQMHQCNGKPSNIHSFKIVDEITMPFVEAWLETGVFFFLFLLFFDTFSLFRNIFMQKKTNKKDKIL